MGNLLTEAHDNAPRLASYLTSINNNSTHTITNALLTAAGRENGDGDATASSASAATAMITQTTVITAEMCQPHASLLPYIKLIREWDFFSRRRDWLDEDISDQTEIVQQVANEQWHSIVHRFLTLLSPHIASLDVCNIIMTYMEPPVYDMAHILHRLWTDPGIQRVYQARSCYQLLTNCEYLYNKILIMGARNPTTTQAKGGGTTAASESKKPNDNDESTYEYIPTVMDILHSRVRTTGIVENYVSFTPLPPAAGVKCVGGDDIPCYGGTSNDGKQLSPPNGSSRVMKDSVEEGPGCASILIRPTFPRHHDKDPRPLAFKMWDAGRADHREFRIQ
jgi:hypothetical protein